MEEHKKFLADRLLSEERPITYRLLSRALDVHVNTAKEMLYDFHKFQNGQTPDSVHATYLVYGSKAAPLQADGDVEMASAMPEQDGDSDVVSATTVTLVAEDQLQEMLSQYDDVRSVHVYSLSPNPQRDLTLLSQVSQSITTEYPASDDGAADARKFGTIVNANVRRRERKKGAPAPAPAAAKPVKTEPSQPTPVVKSEPAATQPAKAATPASTTSKPAAAKKAAGGIMQSFAKAASKPKLAKPVKEEEEDTSMALSDDGEAGDDDMPVPAKKSSAADVEAARKARKDREDDLRRMMEEEEEEEEEEKDEDEEMEEPEPEPEPEAAPETVKKEDKEPQEIVSSTGDGRKRGKRRVMKKKRILDEQGYMVTIQEAAWESFSEDEAPAKKETAKKATPSSTPASSAGKPKKAPAKGSQGNIMSFFGKK